MSNENATLDALRVTFHPALYLQRQTWVLDILRRENVQSVLDIGCGEGSLLQCLTEPSFTLPPRITLPPTQSDLYLKTIHGLDPHPPNCELAALSTAPPPFDKPPFTGYDRWRKRDARWMPLEVSIWEGGFEAINDAFEGDNVDAFVASEVIEHLTPALLPLFAPVLLGYYRPRLLLLTTPNFAYNERFSRPGEVSLTGYPDPTGRTDRVFRHHDHKLEWTTEEWNQYCSESAASFGYSVEIAGIGRAVEPDPWNREQKLGYASQVAIFRRRDDEQPHVDESSLLRSTCDFAPHKLRTRHVHQPHPLSLEELNVPPNVDEIRRAVMEAMKDNREDAMTFFQLWKYGEISLKCKGDIGALARAFEVASLDADVWIVEDNKVDAWETKLTWKNFGENNHLVYSSLGHSQTTSSQN
ncbi:hypothetical protein K439DRAFT_1402650 [Ramaria rubella]|nr:hypothetical protein K439DRAFT_1402650 [Ramaria rubella]